MNLSKEQEEKRQDTLKMIDLCLKLMSTEEDAEDLTTDETIFACEYFKKNGLEWNLNE